MNETTTGTMDWQPAPSIPAKSARKKNWIWFALVGALIAAGAIWWFFFRTTLAGSIVIPYVAHQKPAIDPHLPNSNQLADKLDEVQFDGLFNVSASASGIVYEDALGEFLGIDAANVVSVRLKTNKRWHDSYTATMEEEKLKSIEMTREHNFSAVDLQFALRRIQALGSLSPDYILVSQAIDPMAFEGPDAQNVIRFRFKGDRIWKETDIKEVLSFKIVPEGSEMNALNYKNGTAAYMMLPPKDGVSNYHKHPDATATIPAVNLAPYIDNSTFTTEMRNNNINVLLDTPFGSLSPILSDTADYFTKSNVATTFFAVFFNTERLNREQRKEARKLIDAKAILDRLYKIGTEQQRNIVDYKGNANNYYDYINRSVFPSSTYYIEEKVIEPVTDDSPANLAALPDTLRIVACANFGFREEYNELIEVLNAVGKGRLKVTAVQNDDIKRGNYDGVLVANTGYRSNFLFDLYNIFLREPDLQVYNINLETETDPKGTLIASSRSFRSDNNFFRLDPDKNQTEHGDIVQLLQYVYGFMATRQIGDKQEFARRIDALEREMALGAWMFSLPSLAYFTTQFDARSIDLYGVASQLSTIEKWKERQR